MSDHVYAVCPECAHLEPRPEHALEDWHACENCGEPSPQSYAELEEAEAASEAALEAHRRRPELLTGDDLPIPDDYAGRLPMAGDRW